MTRSPSSHPPAAVTAEDAGSVLQRPVLLSEFIDSASFIDVMSGFAHLCGVGVKVFDAAGNKLVDIRVGNPQFCKYLWEFGPTQQACMRLVTGLESTPFPTRDGVEVARLVDCFSGLRYVVLPLLDEGDVVGRLIFGPYRPAGLAELADELYRIEPRLDRRRASELVSPVRRASDELAAKLLARVQRIVEAIVFTGYRAHRASQLQNERVAAKHAELQETNRILQASNERLQELDKLKSNFLATISHELRTPLTAVIGYAEMLLEELAGRLNDEQREYVKTILDKGTSLLALTTQLLDVTRIERENLRIDITEFSMREVLRAATTSVLPQCQKKKLTLDVEVADELPLLRGDRDKVGQVVVNLLANALKFTPAGGRISLRARRVTSARRPRSGDAGGRSALELPEEDFVRIDVADSGVGIPADQLGRVFDRFYQVDGSSTREFGGTGLGLCIVKSFVEAHRGDVFVESEVGKGSTFTVFLPIA